jgi:monoterpene epsilon-lactone hydrolase
MSVDGSLSEEALAWLAEREPDDGIRTDFSQMEKVRQAYRADLVEASERAIDRHHLEINEIEVGGVPCSRIVSATAGVLNGHLFYVFGGSFMVGDPFADLPVIGALAEYCCVEVIAPKYRLAPEFPAPSGFEDCVAAYRAFTAEYPESLLLAGESAGGNLALLVAQAAVAERLRLPRAMALLSPGVDLRSDPTLYGPTSGLDPTLHPNRLFDIDEAYLRGVDPTDPAISPLFGSMDSLPPTIISTGTRDLFLGMCLRLERKMHRAGVDVECRVRDGLWHVFEFYDELPESGESLREIAAFLNKR